MHVDLFIVDGVAQGQHGLGVALDDQVAGEEQGVAIECAMHRPSSAASGPAIRASQGEASPLRTTSDGVRRNSREPEAMGRSVGRSENLVRLIAESLEQRWMASPKTSRQLRAGERQGRQGQDANRLAPTAGKWGIVMSSTIVVTIRCGKASH